MTIICMRNVEGQPKMRALTAFLCCVMFDGTVDKIPFGFQWDGSSVNIFIRGIFPRHRHPVASCKHDYRCGKAKNKKDRAWADKQFQRDVAETSWRITSWMGYAGVRIGAFFGIGNNF